MNSKCGSQGLEVVPIWKASAAVAVCVFLIVYWTELGQFTLSIDEELATISGRSFNPTWVSQGRWGMALTGAILPNYEAVPFLSTLLFGAGLCFSTVRSVLDFRLKSFSAYLFSALFVGCPLWLHIAEFNTLAGGFGIGLSAAVVGAGVAARANGTAQRVGAVIAMALAISIYQTFAMFIVVYALLTMHAGLSEGLKEAQQPSPRALIRELARVALLILAAGLVYYLIQRIAMIVMGTGFSYVDGFWKLDQLLVAPSATALAGLTQLVGFATGENPMYLGTGPRILFLSWLGLMPWGILGGQSTRRVAGIVLFWSTLAACIFLLALPFILSAGTLPERAHIVWPLIAAWLASRIPSSKQKRWRVIAWAGLLYFVVTATSISATLFYSDRLARDADAALTHQLVARISEIANPSSTSPTQLSMSGTFSVPAAGQIQHAGLFGRSFYSHNGGNIYRVVAYMRILGYTQFTAVRLGDMPGLAEAAHRMPAWPNPDSVGKVQGVVIIKFGNPTRAQLVSKKTSQK